MITNVSHLLRPSHDRMYADLKHCQLQSQVPVHAVGERVCFGFVVYQRPISLSVCALIIQILYIKKNYRQLHEIYVGSVTVLHIPWVLCKIGPGDFFFTKISICL